MCPKVGFLDFWWLWYCIVQWVFSKCKLKDFFLQITLSQTSFKKTPRSQTISLSAVLDWNIRLINSKFEVAPLSGGRIPRNLCLSQNQASLTFKHSQNKCTLSWGTLQLEQLGEAAMLNLCILSLLFMMLWMTMNSNSLPMSPNTGDWSLTHTWSQSASNLKMTLGGGKEVVKLMYNCLAVIFFKFRGCTSPRRQPPHKRAFMCWK